MYSLIGISMVLAAMMLVSLAMSIGLTLAWPVLLRISRPFGAQAESRFWMAVGLFPVATGAFAGLLVVAPGYLIHEPRGTEERIGLAMAGLAVISVALLMTSLGRSLAAAYKAASVAEELKRRGKRLYLEGIEQEAYELPESSRVTTVVGVVRPTMFLSRGVLGSLTEAELSSVLRHERAHVRAHDNRTSLLLDFTCRLSGNPVFSRAVKAQWVEAAELAADRVAVRNSDEAVELLSALVKVARLGSSPAIGELGCSFIPVAKKSHLRRRIENLQALADGHPPASSGISRVVAATGIAVIAALVLAAPASMGWAHAGLELLMK